MCLFVACVHTDYMYYVIIRINIVFCKYIFSWVVGVGVCVCVLFIVCVEGIKTCVQETTGEMSNWES